MIDKAELVITALQQKLGELVSNYEIQIALLRAEITQISRDSSDSVQQIEALNNSILEISNAKLEIDKENADLKKEISDLKRNKEKPVKTSEAKK